MNQRRRLWWNGKYGRAARRDVLIWQDDETGAYSVEARRGGIEGERRWWDVPSESVALELVADLTSDEYEIWRELQVR